MKTSSDNRLLYFCPSWSGGIADYAHEQAQALGKRGVQVTFLTSPLFQKEKSDFYEIRPILTSANAFQSPIALLRKSMLGLNILQNHYALADIIRQENFQYVLLATYSEYLAPLWSFPLVQLAKQGVIFGAIVHDPVRGHVVGPLWWHRWSIACGYSFLREAFVHEAIELDTAKPMHQMRTTIFPIGSYYFPKPQNTPEQVKTKLKIPQHAKVLLSFGHIRDTKNLDLVLKAISDFSDIYLVTAGKVSTSKQRSVNYYQELARSLGIQDRCRWLIDYIPEQEVGDLFNACDIVLLTYSASFRSASSVVNLAVNYRRPCIASAGEGNLKTMVQKYDLGLFVRPDNWQAIRDGIQDWLDGKGRAPQWDEYEQDNSWDKNAEIVCQSLFA